MTVKRIVNDSTIADPSTRFVHSAVSLKSGYEDTCICVVCKSRYNLSPVPFYVFYPLEGKSLTLKSEYEDCVQIQILIPPLPPWVKGSQSCPQHLKTPQVEGRSSFVFVLRPSSFVLSIPELTLSQRSRDLTRPLRGCVSRGCEAVRALR